MKIVYSSEEKQDIHLQIGKAHYSYRFVQSRIVALLRRAGIEPLLLEQPEGLKHRIAFRSLIGCEPEETIHISFRSSENFRPVAGARNVCHFAWEFDVLRTDNLASEAVTENQLHMLNLADEVWAPCTYTRDVLVRNGVRHVHRVPTPVCPGEPSLRRMSFSESMDLVGDVAASPLLLSTQATREDNMALTSSYLTALGNHSAFTDCPRDSRIFLLICNPGDLRKNLLNTIDGFLLGARPNDILILKLLVPNQEDYLLASLYDHLRPLYGGPVSVFNMRVMVIFDFLSDEQMAALYSMADFYLSAPHCEGYNLPLLESMARGTVPVSNAVTAMSDYITSDNAVVIDTQPYVGLLKGMAGDISGKTYAVNMSSRFQIGCAVRAAVCLAPSAYEARSAAARKTVEEHHSETAIERTIMERLGALGGQQVTSLESA